MARPSARRKQQDIDSHGVAAIAHIPGGKRFCRGDHPTQAERVDRAIEIGRAISPLYFDEGDGPPPSRDDVHLAARTFHAPVKHPPALEPQIERRKRFRAPAAGLDCSTGFHRSANARA